MAIGYSCINFGALESNLISKTISIKNGLNEVIISKLIVLDKIIEYNVENNIKIFEINSNFFTFDSNFINNENYFADYNEIMYQIRLKLINNNMRMLIKLEQDIVLNSENKKLTENSIIKLSYYVNFFNVLRLDNTYKIIINIGSFYETKDENLQKFIYNYRNLEQNIKDRLVLVNDEKNYNIYDLLNIGQDNDIPVVFDILNHFINFPKITKNLKQWIVMCSKTWMKEHDGTSIIKYSQKQVCREHYFHLQSINMMDFLKFYKDISTLKIDIILRSDDENLSALKCNNIITEYIPNRILQIEWAKYKYLILRHSNNKYLEIRELMRDDETLKACDFYKKIEEGLSIKESLGSQRNSIMHIWGYFKNISDKKEKESFKKMLIKFDLEIDDFYVLNNFLYELAIKYEVDYLKYSYSFLNEKNNKCRFDFNIYNVVKY